MSLGTLLALWLASCQARTGLLFAQDQGEVRAESRLLQELTRATTVDLWERCGWPPDRKTRGRMAVLVKHSEDPGLIRQLAPWVDADLGGDLAAIYTDWLALAAGRPQTYGTQFRGNEPLPTGQAVESNRAVLGLMPWWLYRTLIEVEP